MRIVKALATLALAGIGACSPPTPPAAAITSASASAPSALPDASPDGGSSVQGARVVLTTDKPSYFLGENALVHYCLENTGATPITIDMGGDYRGASRALRFRVVVTAEDGSRAVDPDTSGVSFGGLSHSPTIAPGARYCASLALLRYARIDAPGLYTVRVSHDLGWEREGARAPEGSLSLRFASPDPAQAERVIADALALPEPEGVSAGQKSARFRDLGVLGAPVYLAPLEARLVADRTHAGEILDGIGSIASPEATRALLRIAGGPAIDVGAASVLAQRMPDPELAGKIGPRSAFHVSHKAERDALIAASWRPEHAPPARALGLRLLAASDATSAKLGGYYLQCVGELADMGPLVDAYTRAIEATRGAPKETMMYPRPRGACAEIARTADILMDRGAVPAVTPRTAGETGVWLRALRTNASFRPPGWEAVLTQTLDHPIAYLRELALDAAPAKPPAAALRKYRARLADADVDVQVAACRAAERTGDRAFATPVLAVLARATDHYVLNVCSNSAFAMGAALDIFRTRARRLSEPAVAVEMLGALADIVDGGRSSNGNAADAAGTRARWLRFIEDNKASLAKGERFAPGDPRLSPEMFPKMTFHRKDGSVWPDAGP